MHEIVNGATFGEEFRVVQDLESGVGAIEVELFKRD
jgi:hypothetical protein